MTIFQAVNAGLNGEKLSRTLTGTDEVSAGRTAVATGSGALLGGVATGAVAVGLGVAAAPVVIPVAVVSGLIAGIRSFWE